MSDLQESGQHEQRFNEMEHKIDVVIAQNKELLNIVRGNPMGTKEQKAGLIGVIDSLSERMDKQEKTILTTKWLLIGMSFPAGYGALNFLRDIFFNH